MQKKWTLLTDPPQSFYDEFPELPPIVAKLLYHRNLRTQEKIDEFLNPEYSEHIYDPFLFRDMKKAVTRLEKAFAKKEKITIHGDYDADGVSASVILGSLFTLFGAKFDVFLPHRETDGYGLNLRTVALLAEQGTKIIITCDCGISNREEVILANEKGIDVIITDHHTIPALLPPAYAIIHPKIEGETYPDMNLAGGGVAFKLAQGILHSHQKKHPLLPNEQTHESFEKWLLDMVAIASVADMVPLIGESRTLTKYGLLVLNKTRRLGLQKLLLEARIIDEEGKNRREIDADTIGFHIAPRINAAGRMNHANVAYNLLMAEAPEDAAALAAELNGNNQDRQKLTEELVNQAIEQVEAEQMDAPVLFVIGKGWTTGIVGLIASRIKDRYQKPTIAMAENGHITGSGRSMPGFNMIGAMQEIPEFFLKFGGHPMACGFTLKDPTQRLQFQEELRKNYGEKMQSVDTEPTLFIDGNVTLEDVQWELYDILDKFKPFGQANEKPRYVAYGITIVKVDPVGGKGQHLRIQATHHTSKIRKMIGWRLCDVRNQHGVNWGEMLKKGDTIDVVFEIDVNEWNGNRELQLTIVDLKKSEER